MGIEELKETEEILIKELPTDKTVKEEKIEEKKSTREEKSLGETKIRKKLTESKIKKEKISQEKKPKGSIVKNIEIKEESKKQEEPSQEKIKEKETKNKETKEWFEPEGQLVVDVYQTNGEIVIQSAVAGVKPEDLDIVIENDVFTIKGQRQRPAENEERNYFYQECYWGRFSREIILPAEVDATRTQASIKEGILTIRIPKIEKEKKRKIIITE